MTSNVVPALETALLLVALTCGVSPSEGQQRPLLLICLHGASPEHFLDAKHAPNIARLSQKFAGVSQLRPVFLTEALPNQISLVTGLTPEQHGFVADRTYDPVWKELFDSSKHEAKWWEGVPTIWAQLAKHGHSSVVYDFEGGATASVGQPEETVRHESLESVPVAERAEAISQAVLDGATFVAVFINEPGIAAQTHGLHSGETLEAVHELDKLVNSIMARLSDHAANVIITGDHGLTALSPDRVIYLEDYVDPAEYTMHCQKPEPTMALWPVEGKEAVVFLNLTERHPHLTVHLKEDIPGRFHYKHHRRIAPILLRADEGWTIAQSRDQHLSQLAAGGYDNDLRSMQTFLVAAGPGMAQNKSISALDVTDTYHLISHLLNVKELQSNRSKSVGKLFSTCRLSRSSVKGSCSNSLDLKETQSRHKSSSLNGWQVFFLTLCVGLGVVALAYYGKKYIKNLPGQQGYRRVDRSLEPDLSLRSEPLLDSSEYRGENSIQLSVMGDLKNGGQEDDDSPPGTFTI